ncbi:MAG: KpsF/GutQ family sugar-phosphate isomerase [Armatimonadetes bacterium]|nr:KpsF/GutQ family sugar-phosphate isomerase [Armatimonadota bacterium]MBX3107953.1 KpsF/GutQ family sugar-phosphate isomerase [Fimbriimonadaceae bacterium]
MVGFAVWQTRDGGRAVNGSISRVLRQEAEALLAKSASVEAEFALMVEWILGCRGRLVTCGIGKSGHIAAKAAATFASTGTPSFFLHAAEAVHGDLGMVTAQDVVLAYTYSGETDEVVRLFPSFRATGARSAVMTGRRDSSAARVADLVLDVSVEREACPNNLAPTTSTTLMLAMSDALAVAAMEERGFGSEDFAKFHPAGALGKRLLLTVQDVMRQGEDLALTPPETPIADLMRAITSAGAGGACVVGAKGELLGFVSDGDLRRWVVAGHPVGTGSASDLMSSGGPTCEPGMLAIDALEAFQNYPKKIGEMPVVDSGRVVGLLVLKDLLRSGIV